ncbi:integrase [Paenibacillus oralis]|uniref:Integrase n=1 Tax=Paenibacillus oralis TaxID=2490856 RepID=A0A3P3U7Q8_9BACL|nr:site-specific integrase [Paenibacillus oralis]RRJ66392.1 integrase [Paenibacillus oralis]
MNIIHENKLFNEKVKREYMAAHKKGTQDILERLFKIAYQFESDLNKDIFDFTREELRKLFFTFLPTTESASKSAVLYINRYIDWAIDEGYAQGMNPLDGTDAEWKKQFAIKPDHVFIRDEDIKKMLEKIVNAQVAVVFYAPFIGIKGEGNAEIVNLKKQDVDFDHLTATLTDSNGSQRIIKIDKTFGDLCQKAIKEFEFVKANGEPDKEVKSKYANLIDNEYIVRSVDTRVKHKEEADKNVVYRRLKTIKKYFSETGITPKTVAYSGMLAIAKDFYLKNKLNDSYKEIIQQFNITEATLNRYKETFLNVEQIKKMYKLS